jgi:Fe-S cluster biogenesis protein NfuA
MADQIGTSMRLPDSDIDHMLNRLDQLIGDLETTPGPAGEIAVEAVSALARLYGEALARALDYVTDEPSLLEAFLRDDLLGHLLVLHDIHPEPVLERVSRALGGVSPAVRESGGEVELVGIDGGIATVRLTMHGCGSAGTAEAVREAVLGVAPELSRVDVISGAAHDTAFIPLDGLMAHAASSGARR